MTACDTDWLYHWLVTTVTAWLNHMLAAAVTAYGTDWLWYQLAQVCLATVTGPRTVRKAYLKERW